MALEREGHFGRAAARAHVSQPALSAAIASLEREFGVPLVRRGRRFEGLTVEGQRVLEWARRVVDDVQGLDQEVSRLRGGLEGVLRLGAIPTALPGSTLVTTRFRELHPRLRIRIDSMTSAEVVDRVRGGELDAGLTYLSGDDLDELDRAPLWTERYLLVVDRDQLAPNATRATWAEAAALPLCLLSPPLRHRRIIDAAFAEAGAEPQPVVETNSVSTLIEHARSGLPGVTAQTWLITHALPGNLRALPLVEPTISQPIGLVTRTGRQRSPIVSELLVAATALRLDGR